MLDNINLLKKKLYFWFKVKVYKENPCHHLIIFNQNFLLILVY